MPKDTSTCGLKEAGLQMPMVIRLVDGPLSLPTTGHHVVHQEGKGHLTVFMCHHHRHNGSLANGDKGRRRSRLALYKRPKANGVKPDVIHNVSTPLVSKVSDIMLHREHVSMLAWSSKDCVSVGGVVHVL